MLARHDRNFLRTAVAVSVLGFLLVAIPTVWAQPAAPSCQAPSDALPEGPVVVQGWVINHRELAVDATRTSTGLQIDAVSSAGVLVSAPVAKDGFFKLVLEPDVWTLSMQLPPEWDSIVPAAPRGGLASTGCTPLAGQTSAYLVVFKVRRLVDVTVHKWEETGSGTVQPGSDWKITFQPIHDPFAVIQTRTTGEDGTAVFEVTPGTWLVYEHYRPGWTPLTPPQVTVRFDPYLSGETTNVVVFKNRGK